MTQIGMPPLKAPDSIRVAFYVSEGVTPPRHGDLVNFLYILTTCFMAFTPASGRWVTQKFPTKASTEYDPNMMIYSDGTDNVPVTTTTLQNILGILKEDKASSATTVSVHILVPASPSCTFFGDMKSGETIAKADEGQLFDFSSTGLTVSTTSTYDAVMLIKFISTTKGQFKLNTSYGIVT